MRHQTLVLRYVVELFETNVWMSCLSSYDLSSPGSPIWPRVIESITVTAHWMAGWRKLSPHRSVRLGWPLYWCVQLTETNMWVCVTPLNDTPVRMKTAPTFRIRVSPLGVAQKWNAHPCVRLREQIINLFFRLSLRPLEPELSLLEGLEIDQSIFTRRDQLHWTLRQKASQNKCLLSEETGACLV